MTRDHWEKKLEVIIARVEAGEAPVPIREVYVFGSFARGAPQPNDLDLIVIHDRPGRELLATYEEAVRGHYDELDRAFKAGQRFAAAMRRVFRRGSERMDVKLAESLKEALAGMIRIPRREIRLIWSEGDRKWEAKVAGIRSDPRAGRHPRLQFMHVKKTKGSAADVETVTRLVDEEVLTLRRLALDEIEPWLNPRFRHWGDYWTQGHCLGGESLKVLPWALWWLQEQGAERPRIWQRTELGDEQQRYHVQVTRIYPAYVRVLFTSEPQLVRQCLIPPKRAREKNWMYVFERGPRWGET